MHCDDQLFIAVAVYPENSAIQPPSNALQHFCPAGAKHWVATVGLLYHGDGIVTPFIVQGEIPGAGVDGVSGAGVVGVAESGVTEAGVTGGAATGFVSVTTGAKLLVVPFAGTGLLDDVPFAGTGLLDVVPFVVDAGVAVLEGPGMLFDFEN
jgi:hypothetical protein